MNGIPSLYQMTPTGVPFRTGTRGESTSEQRYFVPGFSSNFSNRSVPLTPEQQANLAMATERGFTSGGGDPPAPSPFSQMTPAEQAAYYAENPTMAAVTQLGQNVFGLTSLGMLQNALDPIGVAQAQTVAQGINPTLATPLGRTDTQQVTPIAPTPTAQLAQMNQQQAEEDETSPATVAAEVAATVAATADAVDAEGGQTVGAGTPSGVGTDTGAGGGVGVGDVGNQGGGGSTATGGNDTSTTGSGASDTGAATGGWRMGGRVMNYQQGGVASLANRVQERGRGQDTMLVHMTPKEVGGLQALAMAHGGSLSINPRTGLVEAGFLSSILPMVAGAALAATGVGAPMAALMVGGGYGLATGSLSKGLMAGLGAFGGAGLGAGLSAAGATPPAFTGTAPALAQSGVVAPQAAMSAVPGSFQAALPDLGISTASSAAAPAAATTFAPAAAPVTFGNMGTGLSNVIQGTEGARGAFMSSVGGPMGLAKYGGAAAVPLIAGMNESTGLPIQDQFIRPFKYETGRQNVPYRTGERGESTAEQAYFDSRFTPVGVYKAGTEPAYGTYAMGGSIEERVKNGDIRAFDDEYGQDEYYGGGLTALAAGGSPNKPRFLMGKGDGMSDSIPATINNTQPARLADGEFVIPADVVSHLGNGSSKAGAAKLHSMMNRIRKARTGKNRQAPEVRAERYMPA